MSINCVHMLLDLLFKHITNVSVYLKEKFDVLISQFKIPSCEKMQLHLVLFALFIYTIFKEDNTPVTVSTAPTYGDSRGIAGIRCWTITF